MSVLIYLQCCSGIHISSSYRHHRRLTPLRWPLLNRTLLHSDTTLHFNHGETLSDLNANVVSCNLSMLTLLVKPCSVSCVLPYLPLLWKRCLQELSLDWGFTTGLASGVFCVYLISWGLWVSESRVHLYVCWFKNVSQMLLFLSNPHKSYKNSL